MNQEPENIYVEGSSFINDWEDGNYNFDRRDKIKSFIQSTSKEDLIKLNNSMVFDGNFMNVVVQLKGSDFEDTEFFSWSALNQ